MTFTSPGTYVFADNANPYRETVISVLDSTMDCPTAASARVLPHTPQSLILVGVSPEDRLVLEPDWLLIAALVLIVALFTVGVVSGVFVFRSSGWESEGDTRAVYRQVASGHPMHNYSSVGQKVISRMRTQADDLTTLLLAAQG